MAATAQRVEGYFVVRNFMGEGETLQGFEGKTQTDPAYSEEVATEIVKQVFLTNDITYAIQIIQGAQFVKLSSGEVVDNGTTVSSSPS